MRKFATGAGNGVWVMVAANAKTVVCEGTEVSFGMRLSKWMRSAS